MNIIDYDILKSLSSNIYINQQNLAKISGYSVGSVNESIKNLRAENYIDHQYQLSEKAMQLFADRQCNNAIILAAGYGIRGIPTRYEMPKSLLSINGEVIIERIIKQLKEAHIHKIYIVVGFMKECFEYLVDKYDVQLIYNDQYAIKNNLYSLKLVVDKIDNSYIIPSDVWLYENIFLQDELYSWYLVSNQESTKSTVKLNRKQQLVAIKNDSKGNYMAGIAYILKTDQSKLFERINYLSQQKRNDNLYWEEALFHEDRMFVYGKLIAKDKIIEINNYQQIYDIENNSGDKLSLIKEAALQLIEDDPEASIQLIKDGFNNKTLLLEGKQKHIIKLRKPHKDNFNSVVKNKAVLDVVKNWAHSCQLEAYDENMQLEIYQYIDNSKSCNVNDIKACIKLLKSLHDAKLVVNYEFSCMAIIEEYETQLGKSLYVDYPTIKKQIMALNAFLLANMSEKTLCHLECGLENFICTQEKDLMLIDWEYAAMGERHLDIAMFCVLSGLDEASVNKVLDYYFEDKLSKMDIIKVYIYISMCGLLWSNWCELKIKDGIEFSDYSIKQYRYAKRYSRLAQSMLEEI
ncbi:MAG: NTP transferase domain-containing protein [Erysipelotrichaceae bacterium]|nr:NTP transferase domain-containing protein [Erysipelotrichaceae bacterium]